MVAAVGVGVAVVAVTVLGLRDGGEDVDERARALADSACDLADGAHEAGAVDTDSRIAASMLLLDKAIVDSARAAEVDAFFTEIDRTLQAVHSAAHRGDPQQYDTAMSSALAACRSVAR